MFHHSLCHRPTRRPESTSAALGLLVLLVVFAAPAWAATFTVTNANDDGPGSLREAMVNAMTSTANVIEFAPAIDGIPIVLASPLPPITSNVDLTIAGNGPGNTIIDGADAHRPFLSEWANNMALTLSDLTIRNGRAEEENGGAIEILGDASSVLTIKRVEFVGNSAGYEGGAIRTSIPTHIEDSVFENNEGRTFGGAITANSAPLTVLNSSFTGNSAPDSIIQFYGDIAPAVNGRLVNVTVTGNPSQHNTIDVGLNARLSLSNTVVAGNPSFGSLNMRNGGQVDAATSFNNLIGPAGDPGLVDGVNGNQLDVVDPLIGPLGNYGGPTRTLPLLPGSPAIDAGTHTGGDIPSVDQRGIGRVGDVDVGAFESRGFVLQMDSGSGQSAIVGTPFAEPLIVAVSAVESSEPVADGQVQFSAPASGPSAVLNPPVASIGSDGRAQTTATANLQAGGPYTVSADLPGQPTINFSLSNESDACAGFVFPYTLSGTDNAARVAELRQAIECANANGSNNLIDLDGHSLLFTEGSYTSAEFGGTHALPGITSAIALHNGNLERDPAAAQFRFLTVQSDGHLDVLDMGFHGGDASAAGGGAIVALGPVHLRRALFENNRASNSAGGAIAGHDLTVLESYFVGNEATLGGAAIWAGRQVPSGTQPVTILNSQFHDHGDAVEATGRVITMATTGTIRLENLLFTGNRVTSGLIGSVHAATLSNLTLADNDLDGGNLLWGALTVHNAIVWGNQQMTGLGGSVEFHHSLVQGGVTGGTGNIDLDPHFIDPANGNYTLAAASPAIDAGDNALVGPDTFDLDGDGDTTGDLPDLAGNTRRVDDPDVADTGAGTAPIVDMGAFERQEASGCLDFSFPHTLAGGSNAARVEELRQVIACANLNATADEIDLDGQTLRFTDAWQDGDNALPEVTAPLILRNGTLERDNDAPAFRLLASSIDSALELNSLALRGGTTADDGGAIHARGELLIRDSVLAGNSAGLAGGAVAADGPAQVITTQFTDNRAGTEGAAIAGRDLVMVVNARFEGHSDASSRSLIWNDTYFAMVGSLLADNQLSAAGSSLLAFPNSDGVAEMRLVTIADNSVQGPLVVRSEYSALAYNSIIWGNSHASLGAIGGRHNILQDHPDINDNWNVPPGFVGAGDYRLDAGSPAIDAGNSAYSMVDQWDLDGDGILDEIIPDLDLNPRAVEDPGVADTSTGPWPYLDLGAFERQMPSPPAGITVAPTEGLVTGENGDEATFTVVLERYPAAPVSLALASSDPGEGVVAPTQLVFTAADWNQARTVTVIGIDDDLVDGDQAYTILIGPAVSDDPDYHGIDPDDVSVINLDDDVAGAWQIGGTVIGLAGSGLELALDIGDGPLAITGNGSFQFPGSHPAGSAYTVTVATQPQQPVQACVVLNGSGSIGDGDVNSVVVNCGAGTTWSVGGTVTGLDGTVTLQLNGGNPFAVTATGAYAFPQPLANGASYVVSIAQQPAGQLCSLANATGVVAGGDVDNVDVDCQSLVTDLSAALDDGGDHARYGRIRDYLVVVGNAGNAQADAVQVDGQFSAAFDVPHIQWLCVDSGGGGCPVSGSGGFATSANIPAGSTATWIVSAPVRMDSAEAQATFDLSVTGSDGTASASDHNLLVLLRDGFNRPYGDGTNDAPGPEPAPLSVQDSLVIELPAQAPEGLADLARLQLAPGQGQVQVQGLAINNQRFVRLLATGTDQQQHATGFVPVTAGQRLAAGLVDTGDGVLVLLEGADKPLAVTLPAPGAATPAPAQDQGEGQ